MSKQFLDKEGLQIVAEKVNEAREVGAGAMALAQEVSETSTIAFTGTFAQWNALSAGEKAKFAGHIVNITDDTSDTVNAVRNPDWVRSINITAAELHSGYTCPEDGLIIGRFHSDTDAGTIVINEGVHPIYPVSIESNQFAGIQCPVCQGDVISSDVTFSTPFNIAFVPYKTEVVVTESLNYSTEEQFTGKFWIDGKKIYRKIIQDTLTNSTLMESRQNFVKQYSLDADSTISVGGYVILKSASTWINNCKMPINACNLPTLNGPRFALTVDNIDNTIVEPTTGVTRFIGTWYDGTANPLTSIDLCVILEYTKTTD